MSEPTVELPRCPQCGEVFVNPTMTGCMMHTASEGRPIHRRCEHPRQAMPGNVEKSMPCAWPECVEGMHDQKILVAHVRSAPPGAFYGEQAHHGIVRAFNYEREKLISPMSGQVAWHWRLVP